jgi:hypothetical protein
MAAIIRLVSASTESPSTSNGSPTRTRTVGGCTTFHTRGRRSERGHTASVPHTPIGTTGTPVWAARRAAPHRPFSSGSKNARPRGIVPWGRMATSSPLASAAAASSSGSSEPLARSTRMPPSARAMFPTTGASNTSRLPRNRTARPRRANTLPSVSGSK